MKLVSLIIIGSLITLASCGAEKTSNPVVSGINEPQKEETIDEEIKEEIKEELDLGSFKTTLQPLNAAISGKPNGVVTINIKDTNFKVEVEVAGAASGIRHYQVIHRGSKCPGDESDTNKDGVIDSAEGIAVYGPTLIPVDANLKTQIEGMYFGPIANEEGYYFYRKNVALDDLMADLTAEDNDLEDAIVKLIPDQKLKLIDKVFVVYGVSAAIELPATIATVTDISNYESIPVACGRIERLE